MNEREKDRKERRCETTVNEVNRLKEESITVSVYLIVSEVFKLPRGLKHSSVYFEND